MVGIGSAVVSGHVAVLALVGRIVVVALVAEVAIVGNGYVCPGHGPECVGECRGHPSGFGVTLFTICGQLIGCVVGVGSHVVVICMTPIASVGRVVVVAVMAQHTIVLDGGVGAIERPELVVDGESSRCPTGFGGVTHVAIDG